MKFVFKSEHEYGTTLEMTFEEEHLDEIEEMFKLFLRGSGFHIPDEDMYTKQDSSDTSEECVLVNDISATADKTEISATEDKEEIEMLKWEVKRAYELADYRLQLLTKMPENKPWVGLTDEEVDAIGYKYGAGGLELMNELTSQLKERNT
jgi:hypothetical protein